MRTGLFIICNFHWPEMVATQEWLIFITLAVAGEGSKKRWNFRLFSLSWKLTSLIRVKINKPHNILPNHFEFRLKLQVALNSCCCTIFLNRRDAFQFYTVSFRSQSTSSLSLVSSNIALHFSIFWLFNDSATKKVLQVADFHKREPSIHSHSSVLFSYLFVNIV